MDVVAWKRGVLLDGSINRVKSMRKLNAFTICFLFFCFLNLDSKLSALELGDQHWAPNCVKLKKDFLFDRSLDVIFTKKPYLMNKQAHWTLTWNNIGVLIPDTQYKDIYISINSNDEYEILLNTIDGVIITLMLSEDNVMADVFSKTSPSGEVLSTQKGVMTTKELFGGPVRISTIMKLAYKSTPALLTCMEENRIQESAIASALILKGTANRIFLFVVKRGKYKLNQCHSILRILERSRFIQKPFWVKYLGKPA